MGIEFNPDKGENYTGEWKNDKKHGRGWILDPNGSIVEKVWINDEMINEPIMDNGSMIVEEKKLNS